MRLALALASAALLVGCASNEYSQVPEPAGEWVAANPPNLTTPSAEPATLLNSPARRPIRAYWANGGKLQ